MADEDFKYLERRPASDKVLRNKALTVAKNPKYDAYQRGPVSMVYKFFGKKSTLLPDKSVSGSGVNTHANVKSKQNQSSQDIPTYQLIKELQKPIIRN